MKVKSVFEIAPRGREATHKAYEHLGKRPPLANEGPTLFNV
jgi:Holliday junction resolvasome RuvABC ATP-dependent DNA helicase subunit